MKRTEKAMNVIWLAVLATMLFRLSLWAIDSSGLKPLQRVRPHETVEWTESYGFNMAKCDKPRALYFGASILWGFRLQLHKGLEGAVDLSYVATSKSMSDETYDRFLRFWLGEARYDIVYLTPVSHSWNDDFELWKVGVIRSLATVRECCPNAQVACLTTTRREKSSAEVLRQSAWLKEHLRREGVPLVDIWQFTDRGDDTIWRDGVHLKQEISDEIGAYVVRDTLNRLGVKPATEEERQKAKAGNMTNHGKTGKESL